MSKQQDKERKPSIFVPIFNFGILPVALTAGLVAFKYISEFDFSKNTSCKCSQFVANLYPKGEVFTVENKVELIALPAFISALTILVLTFLTMLSRAFTLNDALKKNDNALVTMFNRCISNTLEQSFIFIGLFSYFVFKNINETNTNLAVDFVLMFTLSRAVFIIGYIIQGITCSRIFFVRAAGFMMTLATQAFVLSSIFGIDSFGILKSSLNFAPKLQ